MSIIILYLFNYLLYIIQDANYARELNFIVLYNILLFFIAFVLKKIVYYIISDRNASLYKSENFDRRVRLRTSGTLLTSFIMAFRSRVIYDVLSYRCNYCKKSKK
jgi:hypothetical protein